MTKIVARTVGCDLGDKYSHVCVLDELGEVEPRARIATTRTGFRKWFSSVARCAVIVETGTHSRWVSQLLAEMGHEVVVANARHVRLIYDGHRKNDRLDAEKLAWLARADWRLLHPITRRGKAAQTEPNVRRSREQLVTARTQLIRATGSSLKACPEMPIARRLDAGAVRLRLCYLTSFASSSSGLTGPPPRGTIPMVGGVTPVRRRE